MTQIMCTQDVWNRLENHLTMKIISLILVKIKNSSASIIFDVNRCANSVRLKIDKDFLVNEDLKKNWIWPKLLNLITKLHINFSF